METAGHDFVASAQKFSSISNTWALVNPAAVRVSANPLFGCPE